MCRHVAVIAMLVVCLLGTVSCAREVVRTSLLGDSPTNPATRPLTGKDPATPLVVSTPRFTATTAPATPIGAGAAPPCRALDLAISEGGEMAASGTISLILYFRNQGSAQCSLTGVPGLDLLGDDGVVILSTPASGDLTGWKTWDGQPATPVVLLPDLPPPIPHRYNGPGYALTYLGYSTRGPGAGRCEPLTPAPVRMRLTLPTSGETLLLDWSIGTCDGRIGTSPFQATGRTSP
ncbi:MAG: DUF4232 domain-containing protein [Thermomicrobiales bacterium]